MFYVGGVFICQITHQLWLVQILLPDALLHHTEPEVHNPREGTSALAGSQVATPVSQHALINIKSANMYSIIGTITRPPG